MGVGFSGVAIYHWQLATILTATLSVNPCGPNNDQLA